MSDIKRERSGYVDIDEYGRPREQYVNPLFDEDDTASTDARPDSSDIMSYAKKSKDKSGSALSRCAVSAASAVSSIIKKLTAPDRGDDLKKTLITCAAACLLIIFTAVWSLTGGAKNKLPASSGLGGANASKSDIDPDQTDRDDIIAPDGIIYGDRDDEEDEPTTESTEPSETATSKTVVYKTLQKGDRNDDVKKMQLRLNKLGFMQKGYCTGYYGDITVNCVKLFQKKAKLKQTGVADNKTLTRLYSEDAPKNK